MSLKPPPISRFIVFLHDFLKENRLPIESMPPNFFLYEREVDSTSDSLLHTLSKPLFDVDIENWGFVISEDLHSADCPIDPEGFILFVTVELEGEDKVIMAHYNHELGNTDYFLMDTDFNNLTKLDPSESPNWFETYDFSEPLPIS